MSEREREILTKLGQALPRMSEFDKGYILCMVEKSEEKKERQKKEAEPVGSGSVG